MKIKRTVIYQFDDIRIGDVFEYEHNTYIKIANYFSVLQMFNAFCFDTNRLAKFDGTQEIKPYFNAVINLDGEAENE